MWLIARYHYTQCTFTCLSVLSYTIHRFQKRSSKYSQIKFDVVIDFQKSLQKGVHRASSSCYAFILFLNSSSGTCLLHVKFIYGNHKYYDLCHNIVNGNIIFFTLKNIMVIFMLVIPF